MPDVFISHVEEDSDVALEVADALEAEGWTTWCNERDSLPGPVWTGNPQVTLHVAS